jgi:hypothetical protein
MAARFDGVLLVPTCIGCGARTVWADCPEGCADTALELVARAELEAAEAALEALGRRVAGLAEVAAALGRSGPGELPALAGRAREALRARVPPGDGGDAEVVAAWGCPACGRLEHPRECIGVCIRREVPMVDAARWHAARARLEAGREADRALTGLARTLAGVRPRPGTQERSRLALAARARAVLAATAGQGPGGTG